MLYSLFNVMMGGSFVYATMMRVVNAGLKYRFQRFFQLFCVKHCGRGPVRPRRLVCVKSSYGLPYFLFEVMAGHSNATHPSRSTKSAFGVRWSGRKMIFDILIFSSNVSATTFGTRLLRDFEFWHVRDLTL